MGYWFGFAAVAGAFGGLIAFGVQQINYGPPLTTSGGSGGESDWRILFLIEVLCTLWRRGVRCDPFFVDLVGYSCNLARCHHDFRSSEPTGVDEILLTERAGDRFGTWFKGNQGGYWSSREQR